MSRRLLIDLLAGQTFTRVVLRGKCRYERHESVRLVDGQWWGESSRAFECPLAPQDVCPVCNGAGEVAVPAAEAALSQYDGTEENQAAQRGHKRCLPCRGSGYVPGPHWPYRHDCPPPLRMRS